jgi:hypothetical protein
MVTVKDPELGLLVWKAEFDPLTLRLHVSAKANDDIVFMVGKATKIGIDPKEGGNCKSSVR